MTPTPTATRPTFTPDAVALACTLIAQAQGDTAKARRAASAAVAWMQQPDVDPSYKPDLPLATVPALAGLDESGKLQLIGELQAQLSEARADVLRTVETVEELRTARANFAKRLDASLRTIKALEESTADAERRCADALSDAELHKDCLGDLIAFIGKLSKYSPCDNAPQAKRAVQFLADQIQQLQVQLSIAADAALSCPACSAHAGDDLDVVAEAVERGATVLSLTTAEDVVISAEPPAPVAPVAPAPQPAPAAPVAEPTSGMADPWPQFAHLPEKMRKWAIDRAIAARG